MVAGRGPSVIPSGHGEATPEAAAADRDHDRRGAAGADRRGLRAVQVRVAVGEDRAADPRGAGGSGPGSGAERGPVAEAADTGGAEGSAARLGGRCGMIELWTLLWSLLVIDGPAVGPVIITESELAP